MKVALTCTACGRQRAFALRPALCSCGGTLLADYDLEKAKRTLTRESLRERPWDMWRYMELLPVTDRNHVVSLGEGGTPLLRLPEAERALGLLGLWIKREEQNPTGSFKARGFSAALSIAREHGVKEVAVGSNGNAASALAAYAARAGMRAWVFIPRDAPGLIVEECAHYGANTYLVDGFIHDAGRIADEGERTLGWHNVGTLREPGRAEGKKTMGLEVVEQLGWRLPDVIVYPTGGGSGIIGMWNAFRQLRALGLASGDLPRLVSVQEEGCTPIVDAIREAEGGGEAGSCGGEEKDACGEVQPTGAGLPPGMAQPEGAGVEASPTGMRVPVPPDPGLIIRILRETGGTALSVSKEAIGDAVHAMSRMGISSSPEGAAAWAGMLELSARGWLRQGERVVVFNTSHAMKYWPWQGDRTLPVIRSFADL